MGWILEEIKGLNSVMDTWDGLLLVTMCDGFSYDMGYCWLLCVTAFPSLVQIAILV